MLITAPVFFVRMLMTFKYCLSRHAQSADDALVIRFSLRIISMNLGHFQVEMRSWGLLAPKPL
ncbi:MAG: hypothetical protein K2O70_09070, partial [Desulfovibrionaceae bacterium]|nr:hypothetical protein [Desulfovibrionaceae bacterium]